MALLWTGLVLILAAWHHHRFRDQHYELARVHARATHTKDLIYRQWNAHHGGVYVPITDTLRPNPYLDVPHRDVETLSGQKLTLVNPAYMTRQVHEFDASNNEITAHITSLKPINPVNGPDKWERRALEAFEQGEVEVASPEELEGRPVVRLMRPLATKTSCLKCHQKQGYAEGDIRGGISVAVPIEPIMAARESEFAAALFGYSTVWGLGILGLSMAWKALSRSVDLLEQTNSQLSRQRQIAEEAANVRSLFLANMSHEIRTPLTAILGYSDILHDEHCCGQRCSECEFCDLHERNRKNIETINRNGRHLLSIVNEILDLSKIESGELRLAAGACCPGGLVAEVVSLMEVQARAKGLELVTECAGTLPEQMIVDVTRFRQILLNLVSNAVKFTEVGRVTVVQGTQMLDDRECLVVDVKDTGPGISGGNIDAVFEPFIQGEMSASRQHGGTGLGLAISKRLATALGGRLTVHSALGKGSCFTLSVPIQLPSISPSDSTDPEHDETGSSSSSPARMPAEPIQLEGRILLVEDGIDNQRLVAHILRRVGLDVVIAENGRIACERVWQAAEDERFDLILMDMQMPIMNGYDATRALRQSGYEGTIIALTAHALNEELEECLEAGCNEYAAKPIDRSEFLAILARHLTVRAEIEAQAASGVS